MAALRIAQVAGSEEVEAARRLFVEYERSLGSDLCFQGFEEELAGLPGDYAPPRGRLLVAWDGREAVACGALRPLDGPVAVMKRLYVRPGQRGRGLGRALAEALIAAAREVGYERLVLDTLPVMTEAAALYESLGFRDRELSYRDPMPGARSLELDLRLGR